MVNVIFLFKPLIVESYMSPEMARWLVMKQHTQTPWSSVVMKALSWLDPGWGSVVGMVHGVATKRNAKVCSSFLPLLFRHLRFLLNLLQRSFNITVYMCNIKSFLNGVFLYQYQFHDSSTHHQITTIPRKYYTYTNQIKNIFILKWELDSWFCLAFGEHLDKHRSYLLQHKIVVLLQSR